jgi:hypothetical protein
MRAMPPRPARAATHRMNSATSFSANRTGARAANSDDLGFASSGRFFSVIVRDPKSPLALIS